MLTTHKTFMKTHNKQNIKYDPISIKMLFIELHGIEKDFPNWELVINWRKEQKNWTV